MKRFDSDNMPPSRRLSGATRIVSILSGKGGVGKSVLAFNLAERTAALGVRVLLVDADLNFGNLHILANAQVSYGLPQFLSDELSLHEAAFDTGLGFHILAAGHVNPNDDETNVTGSRLIERLRQQGSTYDLIIIDHSSGVSKLATATAHGSDTNLLVLVPELTSISDCYGLFKYLKMTDQTIDCRLVVNRAETAAEAAYIVSKLTAVCERFTSEIPAHAGSISENDLYRKAVASQTSLAALASEDAAVKEVTALAQHLLVGFGWTKTTTTNTPISSPQSINKTAALADIRE